MKLPLRVLSSWSALSALVIFNGKKWLMLFMQISLDDNASECEGNVRVQAKQNVKKWPAKRLIDW